jgi:hypothetical protein
MIFATENSNKFQKSRFWKEKSVENVVTLGPTPQITLVYIFKKILRQKKNYENSNISPCKNIIFKKIL